MLLSLNDPLVQSTFDQAAKRTTRVVQVGTESRTITTPFPSPQDWRDESGQARPDFPIIEEIPTAQRKPDALVWLAELQRNSFFRRTGKGGEGGGDFESLKEFATDVRDGQTFPVRNALILAYQYAIVRYDVDGGVTTGPARMIHVSLQPMGVHILAKED